VPIAVEITGANIHDKWMAGATLDAVVFRAPRGPRRPSNLCLDKGFDYADTEREVRDRGVVPFDVEANSRSSVAFAESHDAGSSKEPTAGTTASEPCSFATSARPPTTSRSFISPPDSSRFSRREDADHRFREAL
jgi:hypothetical protein